ncbi:DNA methyltransferase [Corynebacterium crudilactis]|uniref:site-specific DNA-methyltransferase (adenine-specific) n=1 Tax=Corynebacterium crudilactis TaxID=1652495 RepID=A0A172QXW3_9CORY|nr:DNA methyltransferase [Corynebacterium crudilactis]ANE05547.1 GcrY protein [Corynebacterium crudilactis]
MTSFTSQRLDRSEIRHNLDQFKHHWRSRLNSWKAADEGAIEKKYAQSFWADFLDCFGISAARMDLFEQDAKRGSTGNTGYIDLFWPGVVIGEAKKPGVDLQIAVDQARDYLQGGSVSDVEQPRYILASDFEHFRLLRLGDPEQRFDVLFPLAEVTDHLDQLRFLAGHDDSMTRREEEIASLKASKIMAALFTAMAGDVDEEVSDAAPTNPEDEDEDVQRTSIFLTRLLFLLFGDDAGLWESDTFYRFVLENTTSENLGSQLDALFDVLNTPEHRRRRVPESMASFPYVNGALFDRAGEMRTTTFFSPDMRNALLDACRFRWTDISPAIFGSLFQLVKSKEARRNDGEHYTSEKNILKTIEPLFLDELREQATKLIARTTGTTKKQLEDLRAFRDSLATNLYIDGACGSGNFLIVAYRELRKIETAIIVAIREREGSASMALDITWEQKLSIGQFHGIEINWWPAKIAETAMFLVDHQANRELADQVGLAPERLPIAITAHIHHGNALQMDWPTLFPKVNGQTYVFGNPPFLGQYTKTSEQTADMKRVWGEDYDGYLDYVTGWHAQAMTLLSQRQGEFAYVTTNSIAQGQPVPALFGPLIREGWRIKFAHRTFSWDSEAPGKAAVHCVIVGFTRDRGVKQRLWDYPKVNGDPVELPVDRGINSYLIDGLNLLVSKRSTVLSPQLGKVTKGSQPTDGGHLIVEPADYEEVTTDPVAAKYVRPFRGAREFLHNTDRWCLWLEDLDPADLGRSSLLKKRVEAVREMRLQSKKKATQEQASTPHLFSERRQPEVPYLCIPSVVSESRRYFIAARYEADTISSNLVFNTPDEDGLQFALISSSMFITWQRTVGGRMKSDLRFANTLTWNTFPVPALDEKEKQRIINAGAKVLAARELYPDRSLAEHYNPLAMSPDLIKAHDVLDREVDKAFGAPRKLTTERQRQELLFANYVRLTGGTV